jgi:hypothetical protein
MHALRARPALGSIASTRALRPRRAARRTTQTVEANAVSSVVRGAGRLGARTARGVVGAVLAPPRYLLGSRVRERREQEEEEVVEQQEQRARTRVQQQHWTESRCQVVVVGGAEVAAAQSSPLPSAELPLLPPLPPPLPPLSISTPAADEATFTRRLITLGNGHAPAAQRCEAGAALLAALHRRQQHAAAAASSSPSSSPSWWLSTGERTLLLHQVLMVGEGLAELAAAGGGASASGYPSRLLRRFAEQHGEQLKETFTRGLHSQGGGDDDGLALFAEHVAALVEHALTSPAAPTTTSAPTTTTIVNVHAVAAAHTSAAAEAAATATAPPAPSSSGSGVGSLLALLWASGGIVRAVVAVAALVRDTLLKLLLFRGALSGLRSAAAGASRLGGERRGGRRRREGRRREEEDEGRRPSGKSGSWPALAGEGW